MARYIDAEKLAEYITTNYCKNCDIYDGEKCRSCLMDDALNFIETFQTADVAPKSEVEKLERTVKYLEGVCESLPDKVKAEVSREIFDDIENAIDNELQNNYKVLPQFEFSNELWNKMSGRIEALKEICDFIAELKTK